MKKFLIGLIAFLFLVSASNCLIFAQEDSLDYKYGVLGYFTNLNGGYVRKDIFNLEIVDSDGYRLFSCKLNDKSFCTCLYLKNETKLLSNKKVRFSMSEECGKNFWFKEFWVELNGVKYLPNLESKYVEFDLDFIPKGSNTISIHCLNNDYDGSKHKYMNINVMGSDDWDYFDSQQWLAEKQRLFSEMNYGLEFCGIIY